MADSGPATPGIVVERDERAKSMRVSESTFHDEPERFFQLVRDGQQVIVTDDDDAERTVMVIGTNGIRIEVHDPEVELPESVEAKCDDIDYQAWLR